MFWFIILGHSRRVYTLGLVYTRECQSATLGYAHQPGQAQALWVPDLADKNRGCLVKL